MSLLDGRPVRNLLEFQDISQVRPLRDHLSGTAIVHLEELSQCQKREVLGLVKVLPAVLPGLRRQRLLADRERQASKLQGTLGHGGHSSNPLSMTNRSAFS